MSIFVYVLLSCYQPFPQPPEADKGGHDARDAEDSKDALANREMDEQTTIARPPLGN